MQKWTPDKQDVSLFVAEQHYGHCRFVDHIVPRKTIITRLYIYRLGRKQSPLPKSMVNFPKPTRSNCAGHGKERPRHDKRTGGEVTHDCRRPTRSSSPTDGSARGLSSVSLPLLDYIIIYIFIIPTIRRLLFKRRHTRACAYNWFKYLLRTGCIVTYLTYHGFFLSPSNQ